jgi:hypothetical protein
MKKQISILSVIAFALALSINALAQGSTVAGEWDVALNTPGGVRNFKAIIKADGDKLSGEVRRETGTLPLTGTVKGKEVTIAYTVNYNGNNLTVTLAGTLEGDTMKGVADFGGNGSDEWSAKRAGGAATAAPTAGGEKIDVSGAWAMKVQTDAGSGSPTFTLKQDGEKLTGKYNGALGESDLTGTVKGNAVEFSFKVTGQFEGTITYSGTTDGKTMSGKVVLVGIGEGTFTGTRK